MMTKQDFEQLMFAAKACGYKTNHPWNEYRYLHAPWLGLCIDSVSTNWNPRLDSAHALRLAATLRLDVDHGNELDNDRYIHVSRHGIELVRSPVSVFEEIEDEAHREDAARLAIVRAAAEIGRAMP